MTPIAPKEIIGKIKYMNNDVFVKDNVKLTEIEETIFNKYRIELKESRENMFDED